MSHTGLPTGLYTQIREYAELVDRVLLDLKAGTPDAHPESKAMLGSLLAGAQDRATSDMRMQLFVSLIRGTGQSGPTKLAELGRMLLEGNTTPNLVGGLESLAQTLEHERVGAFAKIRGTG